MSKPHVLCVSAPNWLGVSRLPAILAAAGCRVSLLAHPHSYAARSRHVSVLIPGTFDAEGNVERLRLHLAEGEAYDWIVFADDPTMLEAARRCKEEWLRRWFPVDPFAGKPGILTEKTRFLEAAAAAGCPVPPSRAASSPAEILAAARELGFPLIIKPSEGSAGKGIFKAGSMQELEGRRLPTGDFAVQRLVAGRSGGTAVLFDHDRPVWWQSSMRTKVWPEPFGPSCRRAAVAPPEIPAILARLAPALGMRGLGEVDWILPEEGGPPQLIEFNPRPPSYLYITIHMGSELPAALGAFLGGREVPPVPPGRQNQDFGLFPEDAVRAFARRDWKDCASWLTGRAGPLPWDEPSLLRAYAWLTAKTFVKSLLLGGE